MFTQLRSFGNSRATGRLRQPWGPKRDSGQTETIHEKTMAKRIRVYLSRAKETSRSRGGVRAATILALFVGIGLSVFLFLTRSWFYFPFQSAVTLCFDISGIFLLSARGWRDPVTGRAQRPANNSALLFVLFLLWASFLGLYFLGPNFALLLREGQIARTESADPSCDAGLLRSLANKPAALGSTALVQDGSPRACTVQWTRAVGGFGSRNCLQLESASKREYYCIAYRQIRFRFLSLGSSGIQSGDMIVARTAFGRPSAFLYPSKTLSRMLFDPRGEIAKMVEDPEEKYDEHLGNAFALLLLYLFLGAILLAGGVA
jgi:hypothetical protein